MKSLIGAAVTAVAIPFLVVLGATPAQAEVWGCTATVDKQQNIGYGYCREGFGSYHVRVECNSGHWPYTRNIDGAVVYKPQTGRGPFSDVNGTANGCHVVKAWVVTL
ncbi:hypothetical protein JOF56_004319 [Kibdelosporangium banguiense]|uniref:Secreted protein n=1 Tax=Kibdelosporangium banguiense TaxID=1365924 RepID=A0ABS4TIT5_9PSEU|nr:hypothetical protein [Kibdelosporangium banguiense]